MNISTTEAADARVKALEAQLAEVTQERDGLKIRVKDMEAELTAHREQHEQFVTTVGESIAEVKAELTAVGESVRQRMNELAIAEAERDALKAEVERLKQECEDADLLLGNGWQEVVAIAKGEAGRETALRIQCTKLTGDVMELQDEVERLRRELGEARC